MALRLATRGSTLALEQARLVAEMLGGAEIVEADSSGEPGDKSRFVRGVERALTDGDADVGVHSAKDLPVSMPEELMIAGVPRREDAADAWVGADAGLDQVVEGARVGTASLRRRSQLLALRPDLRVDELHGNVDTRLRRQREGDFDAIVLAVAGLRRLGRESEISFAIDHEAMTPAAGQGALVLQARREDGGVLGACAAATDESALIELTAERAAIALLGADCTSPVGVHAETDGASLTIEAFVGLPNGSEWVRDRVEGEAELAAETGSELARRLLAAGAEQLLERGGEEAG